jgi:hypothetical protein
MNVVFTNQIQDSDNPGLARKVEQITEHVFLALTSTLTEKQRATNRTYEFTVEHDIGTGCDGDDEIVLLATDFVFSRAFVKALSGSNLPDDAVTYSTSISRGVVRGFLLAEVLGRADGIVYGIESEGDSDSDSDGS